MSSASRGSTPREGLECLLVKMGRTGPLAEPRRGLRGDLRPAVLLVWVLLH